MNKQTKFLIIAFLIIIALSHKQIFSFMGTTYSGTLRCETGSEWWCDHDYTLATASTLNIGNYQIQFSKSNDNRYYYEIKCADIERPSDSRLGSSYSCNIVCTPRSYLNLVETIYVGQEYVDAGILPSLCKKVTYEYGWPTCWRYAGRWACGTFKDFTSTTGGVSKRSQLSKGCYQKMIVSKDGSQIYETPHDLRWQYDSSPNSEVYNDNNIVISTFETSQWISTDNTCYHISNGVSIMPPSLNPSYELKSDGSVDLSFEYTYGLFDSIKANITTTYEDDSVESIIVDISAINKVISIPTNSEPIHIDVDYLLEGIDLIGFNGVCYNDEDTKQKSISQYCDYVKIGGFSTDIERVAEEIVEEEPPEEIVEEEPSDEIIVVEEIRTEFFEPTRLEIIIGEKLERESTAKFYVLLLAALYFYFAYKKKPKVGGKK